MEQIVVQAQEFGAIVKNNNIDDIVKTTIEMKAQIKKIPKKSTGGFFGLFFK